MDLEKGGGVRVRFQQFGEQLTAANGDMLPKLEDFYMKSFGYCIALKLAKRNIKGVRHVINYDLPSDITRQPHYVHDHEEDIDKVFVKVLVEISCEVLEFLTLYKPEGEAVGFRTDSDNGGDPVE
ncbi:hypothetical protein EJ03DRAFT_355657 [Teratosphaeria nubilosa]|uniref:Uncharacterized protein n=1 Tax=Teratosphaeria nubilosa TaxID=161662 RepID=A0A6G1KV99_9PEZI|nr:hypothetical protein EJ03DRAFT_355657 [Teratosphaeria nubilosa]